MTDKKVVDFNKFSKQTFKRKKRIKPHWVRTLDGLIVRVSWYDKNGDEVEVVYDPNNPYNCLTTEGKMVSIENLQSIICDICKEDTEIAVEYTRMMEKAYKYLKEIGSE